MFPSKFLQFPSILTHFHAANEKIQNGGRDLAISRGLVWVNKRGPCSGAKPALLNQLCLFVDWTLNYKFNLVPTYLDTYFCPKYVFENLVYNSKELFHRHHTKSDQVRIFLLYHLWILTHCCLVTAYGDIDWLNIGSGNGLLLDSTKTLPEPMSY